MKKPIKFIFDLDGAVTADETLHLIAKHFNVCAEIDELTQETIQGNIPFVESFIKRAQILGKLPVSEIENLLEKAELYPNLLQFIHNNKENCVIVTENLECWVNKLMNKIDCMFFASEAEIANDRLVRLTKIIRKESIVEQYQRNGCCVVYIGNNSDSMEAMRMADISIAVGMLHHPSKSLLPVSNYLIFNEKTLCRQLNQLL